MLLGICPKQFQAGTRTEIRTGMFITALLTIVRRWKRHEHPLTYEWINKMKYYSDSALRRNEMITHATSGWPYRHYARWNKPDARTSSAWCHSNPQRRKEQRLRGLGVAGGGVVQWAELQYGMTSSSGDGSSGNGCTTLWMHLMPLTLYIYKWLNYKLTIYIYIYNF